MVATRVPMCTVTAHRAWPAQYVVIRPYPDIKSHTCYSCQYRVHNTRYHIAYRPFPFAGRITVFAAVSSGSLCIRPFSLGFGRGLR